MILNFTALLATSIKAFARSVLFSLGVDHALIDFLSEVAIGAGTVLLTVVFAGIRIPCRSKTAIRCTPR